jgi:hypothetical protein
VSLNPRARILAAAGFAALLALLGGLMLLGGGGGSSSSAAVPVIKPLHPVKKHVATSAAPKAKATKKVAATAAVKPKAKPKVHVPAVINGMPSSLALALRSHAVVVVSLYTPGSSVDRMSTDEARRGAQVAHAGFVAFNVAEEQVVSPLSSVLTGAPTPADRVLDGPAVLVFVRPKSLFVRLNGFADHDTVAQAAANASTYAQ